MGRPVFELIDRDGLARRGRIETPHGLIETPALLPVVHPDPSRQAIPPKELRERFGFGAVITSSYILRRQATLAERVRASGLHAHLGFSGAIMTDSGAFQQHAYGEVEVAPDEILRFQEEIGSDIATLLDEFVEPEASLQEAEKGVETTLARARDARAQRGAKLLAVPVQGGLFPELRARSARGASELGDVLAVGGIVPLMESYRFADLVRVLAFSRPHLAPERPVHLFGLGHPMLFALGALFGGDLFDSSSYHKFAKRGTLLFPEGSVLLTDIAEEVCGCWLCAQVPLTQLQDLPDVERETHVARHNLLQCALEISRVRQAIRDGELWELAEQRSTGHPALAAAMAEARAHPEVFLPTEPPSRRSFRVVLPGSLERPAVERFRRKLSAWHEERPKLGMTARRPLSPSSLRNAPAPAPEEQGKLGTWEVATPLGAVPLELTEIYPVGPLVAPEEFAPTSKGLFPPRAMERPPGPSSSSVVERDPEATSRAWVQRHLIGVLEWSYGRPVAKALFERGISGRHSRSSGRLREILLGHELLFVVGNDGLPRPTFRGGQILRELVAPPRLRVVAAGDAVPFVREGRSLFSRHVRSSDPSIAPNESVLVVASSDELLAVGRAVLAGAEMGRLRRGVAVRVVSHAKGEPAQGSEEATAVAGRSGRP